MNLNTYILHQLVTYIINVAMEISDNAFSQVQWLSICHSNYYIFYLCFIAQLIFQKTISMLLPWTALWKASHILPILRLCHLHLNILTLPIHQALHWVNCLLHRTLVILSMQNQNISSGNLKKNWTTKLNLPYYLEKIFLYAFLSLSL